MEIQIEDIQRERQEGDRSVSLSIRTSAECSEFMKENSISPTKLFNKTLELLMKQTLNKK